MEKMDRLCTINKAFWKRCFPKENIEYSKFKQIITACNKDIAWQILSNENGFKLPNELGRLIILKSKPRVSTLYSATRPNNQAVPIFNIHSFGWVFKFFHKERMFLKFSNLWKFRANRTTLKKPLYNIIHSNKAMYISSSEYADYGNI